GRTRSAGRTPPKATRRAAVVAEFDPADVPGNQYEDEEHQERDHDPGVGAQTEDRHRLTVAPANRGSPAASSEAAISRPPIPRPSSLRNSSRIHPSSSGARHRRGSRPSTRA